MVLSASKETPCTTDQHRLERVLSAYQHALNKQEQVRDEKQPLGMSQELSGSKECNYDSNGMSKDTQGNKSDQENDGQFGNFTWQSIKFGAFYFLTNGARAMLIPYLSVYYRQVGLNPHQIGVVRSLHPWVAIPAIPVWGYFADRLNINNLMLRVTLVGFLVSYVALAFTLDVDQVDCPTAIAKICEDSKSSVLTYKINSDERLPSSAKAITDPPLRFPEEKATNSYMTPNKNFTQKVCQPSGQYVGYYYDAEDLQKLYTYFIVVNVVGEIWSAPTPALGNAAVLNALGKKRRNQYSYFKAIGAVAMIIGVLVAGLAVNYTEETYMHCGLTLTRANYAVCFIGFAVGIVLVLPIAWTLHEPEKVCNEAREHHILKVTGALCNIRYGSAFLAITWLSIAVGVDKAFDYWYIEALGTLHNHTGGPHSIMAWTGMIAGIVLLITYLGLPYINDRFGHPPLLVLALLLTGSGMTVNAFIKNPWWTALSQCFQAISTAIYTQSSGAYLAGAVDKSHMATLQTIMAAIMFGVGNGFGSLLGGILINTWSPFICFSFFAIGSFIMCVILIVVQFLLKILQN